MDNDEFINTLKKLYFIDRRQLPELTNAEWLSYMADPARFLIQTNTLYQTKIMKVLNDD